MRVFGYENKNKYPIYVSRNTFKNHVDLLLKENKPKDTMLLSKILAYSCLIIHYIMEESILLLFTHF